MPAHSFRQNLYAQHRKPPEQALWALSCSLRPNEAASNMCTSTHAHLQPEELMTELD